MAYPQTQVVMTVKISVSSHRCPTMRWLVSYLHAMGTNGEMIVKRKTGRPEVVHSSKSLPYAARKAVNYGYQGDDVDSAFE